MKIESYFHPRLLLWTMHPDLCQRKFAHPCCHPIHAVLTGSAFAADFHPAVRLSGGGEPIQLESPGYASPCWADVDGDGKKDLLVGQFRSGKIAVYSGKDGIDKLGKAEWLQVDAADVQIPDVW